jgi:hypothetical protein
MDVARERMQPLPLFLVVRRIVLAGGLAALGAAAVAPDAREILRRAEDVRSPELDYAVEFRLDATDPGTSWKQRSSAYTMIARGKDQSIVLMREPQAFHSGALLMTEGAFWLQLPHAERPLQLSPLHVLGGDAAYGDLARGNLLASYEPRLDGEEDVGGEPCYRLELVRTRSSALHPRLRYWVTKQGYRPKKLAFYGNTQTVLRIAHYEDYREGPLGLRSMRIDVDHPARPHERTVLTFSQLRPLDLSRLELTRETLPAIRDAVRAQLESDGTHARAEDLVQALGAAKP